MKPRKTSTTNRNLTYQQVIDKLPAKRRMVYDVIVNNKQGITSKRICSLSGLSINTVSGRCTELQNLGLICSVGTYRDVISNAPCTLWSSVVNPITFEMANNETSISKKRYRKVKKIIDAYNKLLIDGELLEHEIIIKMSKLI